MIRFLINRPIAVIMSFIGIITFSILAFFQLPVSLLPDIEVPKIVIRVDYPNGSSLEIERNVMKVIRENMVTLNGLQDLESETSRESGKVMLTFDYNVDMTLAFLEVNEKIDKLSNLFPEKLKRPTVARINTSDIPIVRVQVIPHTTEEIIQVSDLTKKVLKRRLEAIKGVSTVDINGIVKENIIVSPSYEKMQTLGVTESEIIQAIRNNNPDPASISVKDGHYQYFLKLDSELSDVHDLKIIPVKTIDDTYVNLGQIARIRKKIEKPQGYHLFNGRRGLVITVHKQSRARMTKLMPRIHQMIENFRNDYPNIGFELTQNQSILLDAGINNLKTSLLFGGAFAFAVLFVFIGNYRVPLIIGISLPVSLICCFLVFYSFDISINIISLSGLALGLGMLIDNAIIVLDNIGRKRKEGLDVMNSCVEGVNEVMSALISSVLTTMSVFIPLIFLHGTSGALFQDQAIAVGTVLTTSLLVSFMLLPLMCRLFLKGSGKLLKQDTYLFRKVLKFYQTGFDFAWNNKRLSTFSLVFLGLIPLSLGFYLKKEGLPRIMKNELLLRLSWNEPIDIIENKRRAEELLDHFSNIFALSEGDIGTQQFLLGRNEDAGHDAVIYFSFEDQSQKGIFLKSLKYLLSHQYPSAYFIVEDTPNAFDQLFDNKIPDFMVKWKNFSTNEPIDYQFISSILDSVTSKYGSNNFRFHKGLERETIIQLTVRNELLSLYNIRYDKLLDKVNKIFGEYNIDNIRHFGTVTPIVLRSSSADFDTKSNNSFIRDGNGNEYPIDRFIDYQYVLDYKNITADKTGVYHGLLVENANIYDEVAPDMVKIASDNFLKVDFSGQYFDDLKNLKQLFIILIISFLLLYFILSAQFESFIQPLVIICILPIGLGGSLLFLWISGASINVMSAIGMVVMLGVIVNDAILKIDTMNRLLKVEYEKTLKDRDGSGREIQLKILAKVIRETGEMRLKPITMTSITTILALMPIIFSSGIGTDLQKPLVYSVIGGLTFGTIAALYFIPLAFWKIHIWKKVKVLSGPDFV